MVAPSVKGLNCPNCGAAIQLRSGELARTVACSSCAAVLDAKDPNLRVLQEFKGVMRWTPLIPLGTRGKLKGEPYQVIGFQVRGINVDDTDYLWEAFQLPGKPPAPRGVYANQPDPSAGSAGALGKIFQVFAAILVAMLVVRQLTARRDIVFRQQYSVSSHNPDSTAFVTPVFA